MHPIISNYFNLPVTRAEVLKRVNRRTITKRVCLCYTIDHVLDEYHIRHNGISDNEDIFPKFTYENAKPFGSHNRNKHGYWWKPGVWNTGRRDFLKWLINEYKDDKTNLREL